MLKIRIRKKPPKQKIKAQKSAEARCPRCYGPSHAKRLSVQGGAGDSWKAKVKLNGQPAGIQSGYRCGCHRNSIKCVLQLETNPIAKQDNQVANGSL